MKDSSQTPDLLDNLRKFYGRTIAEISTPSSPTPNLVVGVSGGLDSVCLLQLFSCLAQEGALILHVAHFNHGLRTEAATDENFVRKLCAELGYPLYIHRAAAGTIRQLGGNLESTARAERYRFLLQTTLDVTERSMVPLLAVAHNADDQAETVLMNLIRGAGLRGLAAMQPAQDVDPQHFCGLSAHLPTVHILRPLLDVTRKEIHAYAKSQGFAWRQDPTNQDLTFTRNYLRHKVMPRLTAINPNAVRTICRSATLLQAEYRRARRLDQALLAECTVEPDKLLGNGKPVHAIERIVVDAHRFCAHEVASQRNMLLYILETLDPDQEFTFEQIDTIRREMTGGQDSSGPHPVSGNISWSRRGADQVRTTHISLHHSEVTPFALDIPLLDEQFSESLVPEVSTIEVGDWVLHSTLAAVTEVDGWMPDSPSVLCAHFDAADIRELILCKPQKGATFYPLGMSGRRKRLRHLFTDHKIPPSLRHRWPLIMDGARKEIAWVCGLRQAEMGKVTLATTTVRRLYWERLHKGDKAHACER